MADDPDKSPADRIPEVNTLLAEWAADSAEDNEALIRRLENLGYEVAGRSREDIAEILKRPPTRPAAS